MSWWGKVVGGTFGLLMGGPLGALMGAALGNYFDSGLDGVADAEDLGVGATERVQSAFFTAAFSVMGYIAKSDGRVSEAEIAMAEQVMEQMQLTPEQRKVAIYLFNEGKEDGFRIHAVLRQLRFECHRRRNLIQMFLEIVVATAYADGDFDLRERVVLQEIASDLGYSLSQFSALLSRLSGQAQFADVVGEDKLSSAYELLGLESTASDAEVKKAYRRQMNQHHPDKLVAKGLPEEMIEIANQKTQDIKAAYELIRSRRG